MATSIDRVCQLRNSCTFIVLSLCGLLLSNAQQIELSWSTSGANLISAVHWSSSTNFDGNIVNVGGCTDAACMTVSPAMSAFDLSAQSMSVVGSLPLAKGLAGPFSSVTVALDHSSPTSLYALRSCSLCFVDRGMYFYNANTSNDASSVPKEFFQEVIEVRVNESAPQGSLHRYSVGLASQTVPDYRCNASCVALGTTVYIIGGIDLNTLEERNEISALNLVSNTYIRHLATFPNDLFGLRARPTNPSTNTYGTSFTCSFGRTSPISVGVNNIAIFLGVTCTEWDAGDGNTAFITSFAFYPSLMATLDEPLFMLFANESQSTGVQPDTTTTAILPFASQFICTGGSLVLGIGAFFNSPSDNGQAQVNQILFTATEIVGHASIIGELSLGFSGAAWNLYTLGGLSASNKPSTTVQFATTPFGIAAPSEIIVSQSWSSSQGLYDNTTYPQSAFGSIVMTSGANVTLRMTELSPNGEVMLSPNSDCSEPLSGTKVVATTQDDVTFPISTSAKALYMCVSDGARVLAGRSNTSAVYVTFFSAVNRLSPMTIVNPSTMAPTTAQPKTPVPTPAPTGAPGAPSSILPSWLPLWAVIVGGACIVILVISLTMLCIYCCKRVNALKGTRVSQRDLIALENITNSNKYTVIRRLGSGGNGEVFLVKRKKDGELCAIKHVRCVGSKTRDDLFRESDTLDRFKGHPNMVEILEMSLHEVYIADEDLNDDDIFATDDEKNTGTYNVSEQTAITDDRSSSRSKRYRQRKEAMRGAGSGVFPERIPTTVDDEDDDGEDSEALPWQGKGEPDGTHLHVKRRKSRGRRKSRDVLHPGDDITVSSNSRQFLEDSDPSSGVDGDNVSRRLIADGSSRPSRANSDISASSAYHSLNFGERPVGRKVRFQCIVMKYFKRGDLASYMEVRLTSGSQRERRNGSFFSSLLPKRASESRDDMASVGSRARTSQRGGYDSDHTSVSRAPASNANAKIPPSDERLDVPGTGEGSDSDEHSGPSRGASDEERNVAPNQEPRPRKVRRDGSLGNLSQASGQSPYTLAPTPRTSSAARDSMFSGASPPMREDVIASVVYQVAALLRYLHSRKPNRIVHCDIKPENILVADAIHPLYLQLLGGHAANVMHAANQAGSGRSPSRLFQRYLNRNSTLGGPTDYGGIGSLKGGDAGSPTSDRGKVSSQASKRTLHRHEQNSSPYFIGQSQRSSVPSTPLTAGGQVTPIGEQIASALEDVFLPIVVSDVGQALEVPYEVDPSLPPQHPVPGSTAKSGTASAGANNLRLVQCTMPYVAPECISSGLRRVSPAIDIWALGCVIYSICTRKLKHTDVVVMFEEVRKPMFADDLRFELCDELGYSPALASLVLAMLHSDPAQRPTAADITNHWMIFTPHLTQDIVPGVMKIQVSVPASGPHQVSTSRRTIN